MRLYKSLIIKSAFCALFLQSSFSKASDNIMVGVLEHTKDDVEGARYYHAIRLLFQKKGSDWISFPNECDNQDCLKSITKNYPSELRWKIAFDGRMLGELPARTPEKYKYYSHIGRQDLLTQEGVPVVGKASSEFSGWMGDSVLRPLVAISSSFLKDPELWKPQILMENKLTTLLKETFKKAHPTCECNEFDDTDPPCKPRRYSENKIIIEKAYQSRSGAKLAQLRLNCEKRFKSIFRMYAVSAEGVLTSLGEGLRLVDTGDYDNDGKSEFIFQVSGYNRDGYLMYYSNFSKKSEFFWNYH